MIRAVAFTWVGFLLLAMGGPASLGQAQTPPPPTWLFDGENQEGGSFADMLRGDLLSRYRDAYQQDQGESNRGPRNMGQRPRRPQPETTEENRPVDLSKYIGPDGDPLKTLEALRDKGKIPPSQDQQAQQQPANDDDLWKDVPSDRRLAFAQSLLERRRFNEALSEVESALDGQLSEDDKLRALIMREKALFHLGHHQTVQNDFYRLKAYYPEKEAVDQLKQYLEQESGIEALQQAVIDDIQDPVAHQDLVNRYMELGWLDFAEEFFAATINDTSETTVKSLSEIYFHKGDHAMLIKLCDAALELHPNNVDILYNKAVGLYGQGDPASRKQAREVFVQAKRQSRNPALTRRIDWYLKRLPLPSR